MTISLNISDSLRRKIKFLQMIWDSNRDIQKQLEDRSLLIK